MSTINIGAVYIRNKIYNMKFMHSVNNYYLYEFILR